MRLTHAQITTILKMAEDQDYIYLQPTGENTVHIVSDPGPNMVHPVIAVIPKGRGGWLVMRDGNQRPIREKNATT